jgi:exopolysaccharide biosynthesis predicted pyruvyltransferase EpsI
MQEKAKMTETNIYQYLNSLGQETVYYFPNPGNGGDSLIAHATYQIFKKCHLNYQILNWQQILNLQEKFYPVNKILIYAGGGNLVNNNGSYCRRFLQSFHEHAKKLIILPHTINTNEDLLAKLGSNVEIICREEVSYNHVKKYAPKVNLMLMDDLAFSLDVTSTLLGKPTHFGKDLLWKAFYKLKNDERMNTIPSLQKRISNNILTFQTSIKKILSADQNTVLNCFRIDSEKTDISIPADNIDLSKVFQYGTASETVAFYASYRLLNFINRYKEVRTNRLHLAIAGALLGKSVKFYANNYYKCEAVYQYSMKNRFPNVCWVK